MAMMSMFVVFMFSFMGLVEPAPNATVIEKKSGEKVEMVEEVKEAKKDCEVSEDDGL